MNYVVVMVTLIKKQTPFLGSENCVCGIEMHDGSCTPSRLTERRAKQKQDIGSASHSEAYYERNATITRPQAHRQTEPTEKILKCEAITSQQQSVCWFFFTIQSQLLTNPKVFTPDQMVFHCILSGMCDRPT